MVTKAVVMCELATYLYVNCVTVCNYLFTL